MLPTAHLLPASAATVGKRTKSIRTRPWFVS